MERLTVGEVTRLLERWQEGHSDALDQLLPLVYSDLRALAGRYLRKERIGHTLQPTALVNEAYVRLVGQKHASFENRTHFFAVASQAMRRVLVDHARRQQAGKRVGAQDKISLEETPENETPVLPSDAAPEILAVHEALETLADIHPRQARLVELRYFGGLSNREAVEVLGVSRATVERDWKVARVWLRCRLASP